MAKQISCDELREYIEQVPGLVMIDLNGIVTFVNDQCASYFGIKKDKIIGNPIMDVFPDSKMVESLKCDETKIIFYNSSLGIGISVHVPLFKNGKMVGLMEYDVAQNSEFLYELSDDYNRFLDQELKKLTREITKLKGTKYSINNIIGQSSIINMLKEKIISTAKTASTVMITGETGTGKELVAHSIHNLSSRRKERFIKVNASAFPEALVESELFGYESGSFTGANREGKKGKFELAHKGTLFIDEINQMPLSVQPKLLRVLQEKELDRIGGEQAIPIDVRIIAASNENLEDLVNKGTFRKDLYYRLNVIEIEVPPLRDRMEDFEDLAAFIIEELNEQLGLSIEGIDKDAVKALKRRKWRGNVRELHNAIERAMNFTGGPVLTISDFDLFHEGIRSDRSDFAAMKGHDLIDQVRNDAERELILSVLAHFNNNKTKSAEYLNIARPLLYQKMKRLGIK